MATARVAIGGRIKQFYRALGGDAQYAPDATTIGTRSLEVLGDVSSGGINEELDAITDQANGDGFTWVPPNKEVGIMFPNAVAAVCVLQIYIPFGAIGWKTIYTFENPTDWTQVKMSCPFAVRVGALTWGSDAGLAVVIAYQDDDG